MGFPLDQYTLLFGLGLVLMASSLLLLRQIHDDKVVGVGQFMGLFLKGNPFLAMSSLIGYHLAQDEQAVVSMTERMGQTRSSLTVDELLEALTDPRFNVRYEAVIAISRSRPDPRLIEALVNILHGSELALGGNAAWALGRLGDEQAIDPLRQGLDAPYKSIQVQSARALGTLGDIEVIPILLERLEHEPDKGLQIAYASALGRLQAKEATASLLQTLETTENEGARLELALALARVVGNEGHFIRLMRHFRLDAGTAASQALTEYKRKLNSKHHDNRDPDTLLRLDESADALARQNLPQGIDLLIDFVQQQTAVPAPAAVNDPGQIILQRCTAALNSYHAERPEYLLLLLHILNHPNDA
jgi:HEAT repeat protein